MYPKAKELRADDERGNFVPENPYPDAYGARPGHPPPSVRAQLAGTCPAMTVSK